MLVESHVIALTRHFINIFERKKFYFTIFNFIISEQTKSLTFSKDPSGFSLLYTLERLTASHLDALLLHPDVAFMVGVNLAITPDISSESFQKIKLKKLGRALN